MNNILPEGGKCLPRLKASSDEEITDESVYTDSESKSSGTQEESNSSDSAVGMQPTVWIAGWA